MTTLAKNGEKKKEMQMGKILAVIPKTENLLTKISDVDVTEMKNMADEVGKIHDELLKKGVRNDDIEQSMMHYIANADTEVKKAMTQYTI